MTTSRAWNQQNVVSIGAPVLVGIGVIVIWELAVQFWQIPKYLLPAPRDILQALIENRAELMRATMSTLSVTIKSFLLSIVIGALTAFIFVQSRAIEICLFPFAILLQVTPLVAIAPLIIILVKDTHTSLIICTILIAIFPIISNTTVGLHSVDTDLLNYFRMNKASRFKTLMRLRIPAALPYFMAGLKISSGLALIGAIVAEFVAGTGGRGAGLAYEILLAGFQLEIPLMFASLVLIGIMGVLLFVMMNLITRLLLGSWHESYMEARV